MCTELMCTFFYRTTAHSKALVPKLGSMDDENHWEGAGIFLLRGCQNQIRVLNHLLNVYILIIHAKLRKSHLQIIKYNNLTDL